MKRKDIKNLIVKSITQQKLDDTKIISIAETLKKSELRQYIHYLKKYQQSRQVIAYAPAVDSGLIKHLHSFFFGKDIIIHESQELGAGLKVINGDMLVDMTVSAKLDDIVEMVEEKYN